MPTNPKQPSKTKRRKPLPSQFIAQDSNAPVEQCAEPLPPQTDPIIATTNQGSIGMGAVSSNTEHWGRVLFGSVSQGISVFSSLVGLGGAIYVSGWITTWWYLEDMKASWVIYDMPTAMILKNSLGPFGIFILVLLFVAAILSDLPMLVDKLPWIYKHRRRWNIITWSIVAACLLIQSQSKAFRIVSIGIYVLILSISLYGILRKSLFLERNDDTLPDRFLLLFSVSMFLFFLFPFEIGALMAAFDKNPNTSRLPRIEFADGKFQGDLRLLFRAGERYFVIEIIESGPNGIVRILDNDKVSKVHSQ